MQFFLKLKHNCPRLWRMAETCNGALFGVRYGNIARHAADVLPQLRVPGYRFALAQEADLPELSKMLCDADPRYVSNFRPHDFDVATMERLHRNRSFLMMKAVSEDSGEIVGYFFLRCFVVGKAFHGLYVKPPHTSRGLGTEMWRLSNMLCQKAGLRMYATIADCNVASVTSLYRGCQIERKQPISNGYHLYEVRSKK